MKVVICDTYGGFSLSRRAFLRLRELGSDVALNEPDDNERWDDGSGPRRPGLGPRGCFCREIDRSDPLLLLVIHEMGVLEASGDFCHLKVVEVPNGVEWEIQQYDGSEWVAEKHRTWS